eukprot:m.28495 g.28495  ORF g.28495 m.28495 type:complete len:243 (-) comp6560_c0_seq1:993-1721(-)
MHKDTEFCSKQMSVMWWIFLGVAGVSADGLAAVVNGRFGPEIRLNDGPIRGVQEGSVNAFRGIPFASPPIGKLRWTPPQPVLPWTDVRDASTWGSVCVQTAKNVGKEDCLFINVHTPTSATPSSKLPVLLWIHGGGYQDGSGNVNGTALVKSLQGKAIVVSSNYRLNIYGFLGGQIERSWKLNRQLRNSRSTSRNAVGPKKHCKFWGRPNTSIDLWMFCGWRKHDKPHRDAEITRRILAGSN